VVPAPVRARTARLELARPADGRVLRRRAAVLVRPRLRRCADRRRPRAGQGAGPARPVARRAGRRAARPAARHPAGVRPGGGARDLPAVADAGRLVRRAVPARSRRRGQPGPGPRRPLHPPRRAAPGVRIRLSHRAVGRRRLAPGRHGAPRDPAARRRCRDVGGGEPRRRPHPDPVCTARSAAGRGAGARGAAGRARAARRRVPVPGPGAGSARGRRPRVRPPGPGVGTQRALARRLPRADPVAARSGRNVRVLRGRRPAALAAGARRLGRVLRRGRRGGPGVDAAPVPRGAGAAAPPARRRRPDVGRHRRVAGRRRAAGGVAQQSGRGVRGRRQWTGRPARAVGAGRGDGRRASAAACRRRASHQRTTRRGPAPRGRRGVGARAG